MRDITNSRNSILLTHWSTHVLAYSIIFPKENEVTHSAVLEDYIDLFDFTEQEFDRFIQNTALFNYSFQAHKAVIESPFFTLVPDELLANQTLESLLAFNVSLPSGKLDYRKDKIANTPYHIVYALPENLVNALTKEHAQVEIEHSYTGLVATLTKEYINQEITIAFKQENAVLLCDFSKGKLTFCNSFDTAAPEDFVYHVLNLYRQLNYHHEKRPLMLLGGMSEESETSTLLKQYVSNVNFISRPAKLSYGSEVLEQPQHYFTHHYFSFL